MIWRVAAVLALLWVHSAASALECRDLEFDGLSFAICEADPAQDDIQLFHKRSDGSNLGSFRAIARETGRELQFAMNGGMYHDDRSAVGLYIEDGEQGHRIITSAGPGNFGMLPNGVFCVQDGQAAVIESRRFAAAPPACRFATQSGPMLVIDGALHPRFIVDSPSVHIRNGVGVREDGTVVFAISNRAVNFETFGRLFRDVLDTPNALFLDGKISRLYAPQLQRNDFGFSSMGPMIGILAPE